MDDDMSDENHLCFPYIKFEKTFLTILNVLSKEAYLMTGFFVVSTPAWKM